MFQKIVVEISNSYTQTVMTRSIFHSPPLSQYSGHLVDHFTHFFSLQSLYQVCFQMQLSFKEKFVVTRVALQNYVLILFARKKKERGKKEFCDCVT